MWFLKDSKVCQSYWLLVGKIHCLTLANWLLVDSQFQWKKNIGQSWSKTLKQWNTERLFCDTQQLRKYNVFVISLRTESTKPVIRNTDGMSPRSGNDGWCPMKGMSRTLICFLTITSVHTHTRSFATILSRRMKYMLTVQWSSVIKGRTWLKRCPRLTNELDSGSMALFVSLRELRLQRASHGPSTPINLPPVEYNTLLRLYQLDAESTVAAAWLLQHISHDKRPTFIRLQRLFESVQAVSYTAKRYIYGRSTISSPYYVYFGSTDWRHAHVTCAAGTSDP